MIWSHQREVIAYEMNFNWNDVSNWCFGGTKIKFISVELPRCYD